MAAQAAHLVDCVLPPVPIRQFVLSFPFELSLLAATKPEVLRALARIHAEELARHYKPAAKRSGEAGKLHAGAVTFVQRFGSSLNLHVHLHTCALDGVYVEGAEGHGVLAPRAKLRPRVVPKLPGSAPRACRSATSRPPDRSEPRGQAGERPPPRDKTGPIIPTALPVSATRLARSIDGADVPMPNVLSARHLSHIGGGQLYAATSNVPWATLLARTFDVDVKSCARCGGRLEVRAVVTDHDIARKILDAIPTTARAPPPVDSTVACESALA